VQADAVVKGGLFVFDCRHKGLTQNALSELSGLSHSALSKIDNNKLSPTFEPLLKIISDLNIDISDLLTSIQNKTPQRRKVFTRKGKGVNS
jgi:transcriptional regulator with XRE-family HTH domain